MAKFKAIILAVGNYSLPYSILHISQEQKLCDT